MIRKSLLVLAGFVFLSGVVDAATFYMNANGTEDCTNLHECFANMSGGDTLIIRDGVYQGYENTMDHTFLPPSGSESKYTIFMAENPGGVFIDGEGIWKPIKIDHLHHIRFDGIVFGRSSGTVVSVTYSDHLKITRCGVFDAADNGEDASGDGILFRYVNYSLIEDTFMWGNGRYKFYMLDSDHIILRRCINRPDRGVDVGYSNQGSFRLYATSNSLVQDCISIDANPETLLTPSGEELIEANPKTLWIGPNPSSGLPGTNNTIRGLIGLNTGNDLQGYVGNSQCSGNIFLDSIFWDSGNALWTRSGNLENNVTVSHCTFGRIYLEDSYHDHAVESDILGMISTYDSIVYGTGDSGFRNVISDYNVLYNNSYNFQGGSQGANDWCSENSNEIDPLSGSPGNGIPALKYICRVEDGSDFDGAASDGGDVGAKVIYRHGRNGTIWGEEGYNETTNESLWPWPDEDMIKTFFSDYSYYSNLTNTTINGTRGFCSNGTGLYGGSITLTSYIWEYLGNPCPPEICDYAPVYHQADTNQNGLIDMPELMLFIGRWKLNDGVSKSEVEEARDIWFGGGVY